MKKIITFLMMVVMLCSVAFAIDEFDERTGNPFKLDPGGHSGFKQDGAPFSVLGGFKCSEQADWTKSSVVSSSQLCWNNLDGKHGGVIYQLFHLPKADASSFDYKVGELHVLSGKKECMDVPEIGDYYFRQAFYCDDPQTKCEEVRPYYTAGCDYSKCKEGEVLRKRVLRDVVPGGCDSEGWVEELCVPDGQFNRDCTPADKSADADAGNDGSSAPAPDPSVNLKGEWQNPGIPTSVLPGEKFEIFATWEAFETGSYYLEAGMLPSALSITASGSKCDDSENFAGVNVDLEAGESVDIKFTPVANDKEGTYTVVLGAYSGCLNNGGEKVNSLTKNVKVEKFTVGPSSPANKFLGVGFAGAGIGALLFFLIAGLILYWMFK